MSLNHILCFITLSCRVISFILCFLNYMLVSCLDFIFYFFENMTNREIDVYIKIIYSLSINLPYLLEVSWCTFYSFQGMDLYFKRHDGYWASCNMWRIFCCNARCKWCRFLQFLTVVCTCLYFLCWFIISVYLFTSMLMLWFVIKINFRYSKAGTPTVKVTSSYNAEARTYSLRFR